MKPGELLNMAFQRRFGPQDLQPAQAASAAPSMPSEEELGKLEKIAATQMLTDAQSLPPIGMNDVAVILAAMRNRAAEEGGY